MKKVITFIVLCAALVLLGFFYSKSSSSGSIETIDFIARHIDSRGNIMDMQGDLGVVDSTAIQWFDDGKNIKIKYGKVSIDFKRNEFLTKETKQLLNRILIDYKYNKDADKLRVFWRGEEIPRYVKE